jgi:hypothetical protein
VEPAQYWQFQPLDTPGLYALRCSKTGIKQQLSACYNKKEVDSNKTGICMTPSTGEESQKWQIDEWGDKSYRMINVDNGTDFYLAVHKGNPPYMSSNIRDDIEQPSMHWYMTSAAKVDEADYSTVFTNVCLSLQLSSFSIRKFIHRKTLTNIVYILQVQTPTTSTITSTITSDPNSTSTASDTSSKGLSSGAAAGIGIGVGLVVTALGIAAFFLWRRRRRNQISSEPVTTEFPATNTFVEDPKPHDGYYQVKAYAAPQEVHTEAPRHELDATPVSL